MPEVIHEHEETTGSSALGVVVGALIVILILLAIWWFGFGPAHGTTGAPGGTNAPVASAPAITIPSAPAGGSPGASTSP